MSWLSYVVSNVLLASLLALAACGAQRWLKQHAIARVLWLLALVKLVTPPMLNLPLPEPSRGMACALGTCGCGPHGPAQWLAGNLLPWIMLAAWLAGAAVASWTAWRRWCRFNRLLTHARPSPPAWQALVTRLAGELSLRRVPRLLAVPGSLPPLVLPGWRAPRVLLPMALMGQLNAAQRETLLLHELVHVQRGDHWVRMLELLVGIVFWWLPITGWIGRHLRACEEACCDAAVVARRPHARREYAQLLLDVVDFAHAPPRQTVPETMPQATMMSAADDLEQRLRAILHAKSKTPRVWPAGAMAIGLACVILPSGWQYDAAMQRAATATTVERQPVDGTAAASIVAGRDTTTTPSLNCEVFINVYSCPQ